MLKSSRVFLLVGVVILIIAGLIFFNFKKTEMKVGEENIKSLKTNKAQLSEIQTEAQSAPIIKDQELKILTAIPKGELGFIGQFSVTFNQPMVALGDYEITKNNSIKDFFIISPELKGTYRWLNQYTLSFVPEKPLRGAQEGNLTVKAGLKSLSGAILSQDYSVAYKLPEMAVNKEAWGPKKTGLNLQPKLLVTFTQPVDFSSLDGKISFVYYDQQNQKQTVPAILEIVKDKKGKVVRNSKEIIVSPAEKLPLNSIISIQLKEGIRSLWGPIPMQKTVSLEGVTYAPLDVKNFYYNKPYDSKKKQTVDLAIPDSSVTLVFNNPVNKYEAVKKIVVDNGYDLSRYQNISKDDETSNAFDHEPLDAQGEYDTSVWVNNIYIPGPFKPETKYNIKISEGLTDIYGQKTTSEIQKTWQTAAFSPILNVAGNSGVLESKSKPEIALTYRSLSELNIEGQVIAFDSLIPFLRENKDVFNSWQATSNWYPAKNSGQVSKITKNLGTESYNGTRIMPLNFPELFSQNVNGFIFYQVSSPQNKDSKGLSYSRSSLIQITDLGISGKIGQTSSLIWLTNISTGIPWPEAKVEIRDLDNRVIWEGLSKEDGTVLAPGYLELSKKSKNKEKFFYILAQAEGQVAMLSEDSENKLYLWDFNLDYQDVGDKGRDLNWLISALPVYKPGEEVKLKIIKKISDGDKFLSISDSFLVEIKDPFGDKVFSENIQSSAFGSLVLNFSLDEKAKLGDYYVYVSKVDDDNLYGNNFVGSIKVEAYRKPTFNINFTDINKEEVAGSDLLFSAKAMYHFGLPVSERPVKYSVTAEQTTYLIPGYEDFTANTFASDDKYRWEESESYRILSQGQDILDENGNFTLSLKAEKTLRRPQKYTTEFIVTDLDQRTVANRQSILLHPANYYVGLKNNKFIIPQGKVASLDFIVTNLEGQLEKGVKTKFKVIQRNWETIKRKSVGSVYEPESNRVDTIINETSLVSEDKINKFEFTPEKAGFYIVEATIEDKDGQVNKADLAFYVFGSNSVGWPESNTGTLDLIADKKEYKPGDTAQVMLQNPFSEAWALLTVERNGVREHKVVNVNTSTPVFDIPLTEDDSPNVFVSVLLVRGRVAEQVDKFNFDYGKPTIRLAYLTLPIKSDRHLYKVTVKPEKTEVLPGEEVEVEVKVTDYKGEAVKAELALIAADAAVIQLIGDRTYYPETLFLRQMPLRMTNLDSRVNLIGRRDFALKGAPVGGGGAADSMGIDGLRKHFASLVHFDPLLLTDENGEVKVKIKFPENLSTFKIYAVATGLERESGTGVSEVLVTKDLLIQSSLPNYAGVNDEFTALLTVHNRGKQEGLAKVKLKGNGFIFKETETAEKEINILAGESQEIGFNVIAGNQKKASFIFEVKMADQQDAVMYDIPLSLPNSLTTEASFEEIEAGKITEVLLKLKNDLDLSRGGLEFNIAPSLVSTIKEPYEWLRNYPHKCLEQENSKAIAALTWLGLQDRFIKDLKLEKEYTSFVETHLNNLKQWQEDGGFPYWPGQRFAQKDPYLTAYVLEFLILAQEMDFKNTDDLISSSKEYLLATIKNQNWPSWYLESSKKSAAIYMISQLSKTKENVASLIEIYFVQASTLSTEDLANLIVALNFQRKTEVTKKQIEALVQILNNRLELSAGEAKISKDFAEPILWWSKERTMGRVIIAFSQSQPDHPHLASLVRFIISEQAANKTHFGSTQSNAVVLLGLLSFSKNVEVENLNLILTTSISKEIVNKSEIKSFNSPVITFNESVEKLAEIKGPPVINFKAEGAGKVWAAIRLKTALKAPDLSNDTTGGFIVSRSFQTVEPKLGPEGVDTFKRGDVVKVTVMMLLAADRHWVILEDRVPAGFEPINFRLLDAGQSLKAHLSSEDEDNDADMDDELIGQYLASEANKFWYDNQEIWPDKVAVYGRYLPAGLYSYSYLARAVTPGVYLTPGAVAEEMYAPETFGRSFGHTIIVK